MRDILNPVLKKIARWERENYQPLEGSKLKEEAKRLVDAIHTEAAGRVCWESREEWEAMRKAQEQYCRDKKEFDSIVNPPPKLKGRKAADRIPFL